MTEQNTWNRTLRTGTITQPCDETIPWGYSVPDVRIAAYALSFVPVLVLILNVPVIFHIVHAKRYKKHSRMFLLSLMISDILVATVVLPVRLYDMLSYGYMDNLFCKFGNGFDVFRVLAAMCSMTILVFDRYLSICRPFKVGFWFRKKYSVLLLVLSWGIPAFFAFVFNALNLPTRGVETKYKCLRKKSESCIYLTNTPYALSLTVIFVFLAGCIIVCNKCTLASVKRRTEMFYKVIFSTKPIPMYRRHFGFKTARMIIWMSLCFILCWIPFFTVNALDPILGYRVPRYIWIVVMWMTYANSAMNPVVYMYFSGILKFN